VERYGITTREDVSAECNEPWKWSLSDETGHLRTKRVMTMCHLTWPLRDTNSLQDVSEILVDLKVMPSNSELIWAHVAAERRSKG
jgi:hypothetical protein